jgi:FkbM family methyltransferase
MDALLQRRLPDIEGAFIDVGANIGQTLFKVLAVDPDRQYYGFEPQVSCCADIARFADINGLGDVNILPIGLSDETRMEILYARGPNDIMASIFPNGGTKNPVQLRRGDDVIRELGIGKVGVIKVDVEGAEWRVFAGLKETLERDRPFLIFEILHTFQLDPSDPRRKERAERLQRLLAMLVGYRISHVHPDGREELAGLIDLDDQRAWVSNDFTAVPV